MSVWKIINGTRFRLIAVGLLATVPVVLTQFLDARSVEQAMVSDLRRATADRSANAVSDIARILEEAGGFTQLIGRLPEVTIDQPLVCSETLKPLAAQRPWAKSFLIADPKGTIACATDDRALELNIADRDYFKQAVLTRRTVVSDILVSRLDRLPSLAVALPQFAFDGKLKQVVLAAVELDWVVKEALKGSRSENARAVLIDAAGNSLGAYDADGTPILRADFAKAFDAARRALGAGTSRGLFESTDEDGVNRVYATNVIPGTASMIATGLSRDDANAATRARTDHAFVMAGLAAAIVFLLAWFAGEFLLVRPMNAFMSVSDELNAGRLGARVALTLPSTQFEAMATAFNAMAGRLEKMALEDSLTGVANRRDFDKVIGEVWKRAAQNRVSVALGFIDVDKFKAFNDRYGHLAGDMVLRQVGQAMKGFARRADDLVARYGGEEFAILLWGNSEAEARAHCEELRLAVEAIALKHEDTPDGLVTVSIGVAAMVPAIDNDPQELVSRADLALYIAKSRGRNRVVAATDQTPARPQLVA